MTQTPINETYEAALDLYNEGKLVESEQICITLVNNYPKHLSLLGSIALKVKRPDIAVERFRQAITVNNNVPELHYNLAVALLNNDDLADAAIAFEEAIRLGSQQADIYSSYANTLRLLGRIDKAIDAYKKSVDTVEDAVTKHHYIAKFLIQCERFEEAEKEADHALKLDPESTDAHFDKGLALRGQDDTDRAIQCYEKVIAINPNLGGALNNLGSAHNDAGDKEKALYFYRRATEAAPENALFWFNLASEYYNDTQYALALHAIRKAIALDRSNQQYWKSYAAIVSVEDTQTLTSELVAELQYCLQSPELSTNQIRCFALNIFLRHIIVKSLELSEDGIYFSKFDEVFSAPALQAKCDELSHPLFIKLFSEHRVNSTKVELFLSAMRRHLLDAAVQDNLGKVLWKDGINFLCALASQCFLNEYVYWQVKSESQQLERLVERVAQTLKDGQTPAPALVALIGCYRQLGREPFVELLRQDKNLVGNPILSSVFKMQIDEPLKEIMLRDEIQVVTPIKDEISTKVREQYEQNPYPRWSRPRSYKECPMADYLSVTLPLKKDSLPSLPESPRILVAGCGSGQQPIDLAINLPMADITALDLSKTSLAYAIRKSGELGVTNINFGQADLLELKQSNGTYDYISCAGVLHHMGNPELGLDTLLECLKPGGIMQLGLYSEIARRPIVAAREFISKGGYSVSEDDIRRCRRDILALPSDDLVKRVVQWGDFSSTSTCRDLLFHVQEHRFTLPKLNEIFKSRGLTFLGFFPSSAFTTEVTDKYCQRFPDDPEATNLINWSIFEEENPDTFINMYQFYIHKPAS
jgi:tetratricopeptide (TPR) repeat protein/2-polyprenyl-3-methyl-5-hydroxy-6-metoxy-1,4-benzoquinol methylase